MKTYIWIALKYLLRGSQRRFFSLMSIVSMAGVAIGVMTLVVVLAVMSGFDRDLKSKILGLTYDLVATAPGGIAQGSAVIEKLKTLQGVDAISPFIDGQALISSQDRFIGVHLRGVSLKKEMQTNDIAAHIMVGPAELTGQTLLVGEELLNIMDLSLGERVILFSPVTGNQYPFTIGGIFKSGYYEYDANLVLTSIEAAQEVLFLPGYYSGVGLKASERIDVLKFEKKLSGLFAGSLQIRSWVDLNRNFFAALELEKVVMFIILALIVLVAAFNIISTLTVFVTDKTKDIGIFKSIGMHSSGIKNIFMFVGLLIAGIGIVTGAGMGIGLCLLLARYKFIQLPADIYYIQYLPVQLKPFDITAVVVAAFLICLVFTLYPARKAALLDPAEAVRYE